MSHVCLILVCVCVKLTCLHFHFIPTPPIHLPKPFINFNFKILTRIMNIPQGGAKPEKKMKKFFPGPNYLKPARASRNRSFLFYTLPKLQKQPTNHQLSSTHPLEHSLTF
jgi:hypothetical protein